MAQVQITDVVIPEEFTSYHVENSVVSTALSQSGVVANNGLIEAQLDAIEEEAAKIERIVRRLVSKA